MNRWRMALCLTHRKLFCELRLRDMEKGFFRQFLKETKDNEATVFIQSLLQKFKFRLFYVWCLFFAELHVLVNERC